MQTSESTLLNIMDKSPQLEHIPRVPSPSPEHIAPEFLHLALAPSPSTSSSSSSSAVLQLPKRDPRRASIDGSTRVSSMRSLSTSSSSSASTAASTVTTTSSTGSVNKIRRYSKTPVLHIGQLENTSTTSWDNDHVPPLPLKTPPVPKKSARRSSAAEQMAEQYRALLHSQSCAKLRMAAEEDEEEEEEEVDPRPKALAKLVAHETTMHDNDPGAVVGRHYSIEAVRSAVARQTPAPQHRLTTPSCQILPSSPDSDADGEDAIEGSPTSSDGTFVAFEEDAIYFKPSFPPECCLSPIPEDEPSYYGTPLGSPSMLEGDALSLQICVDLLGKELMAAMERQQRHGEEGDEDQSEETTSQLQIWLMIEAYERLRDKMAREDSSQARSLGMMFDTWLQALYRVHDDMVRKRAFSR